MIAKIKTRADFGGIVNYANDQKNKKKCATLLAHEGVVSDTSVHTPESKKSGETRITCFFFARH